MRKLIVAAAIVVTGLLAAYLASPYWTLHQIRSASAEGQGDRVAAYVNFPAVRESLKSQFSSALNKRIDSRAKDSPLSSVGQAFAAQMMSGMVDAMITPESGANMIRSGKAPRTPLEMRIDRPTVGKTERREPRVRRGYEGLNTFQAALVDPDTNEDMLTAVLSREGMFTWKLTAITLPGLMKP